MRRWTMIAVIAVAIAGARCSVARFLVGAPPAGSTSPARTLLARRCAGCHAIPDPSSMSAAAWSSALERMKLRMRLPARIHWPP